MLALEMNIAHIIKRYTNVLFTYLLTYLLTSGGALSAADVVVQPHDGRHRLSGWLRGPAVEHRSLAGMLSLSCAQPIADG